MSTLKVSVHWRIKYAPNRSSILLIVATLRVEFAVIGIEVQETRVGGTGAGSTRPVVAFSALIAHAGVVDVGKVDAGEREPKRGLLYLFNVLSSGRACGIFTGKT